MFNISRGEVKFWTPNHLVSNKFNSKKKVEPTDSDCSSVSLLHVYKGHTARISSLKIQPDTHTVLSASLDGYIKVQINYCDLSNL